MINTITNLKITKLRELSTLSVDIDVLPVLKHRDSNTLLSC